jgi:V8-like Glu-specific endopeptidase
MHTSFFNVTRVTCLLLSSLMGCAMEPTTEGVDDDETSISETSDEILNGIVENNGHKAVIAVGFTNGDGQFVHDCTGVLITPRHLLTAAHCTDQAGRRSAVGTMSRTIRYFKPGNAGFVAATGHNETLDVRVIETWDPLNGGPSDAQDDIALVTRRGADWRNTTASDYMPIWAGSMSTVDLNTFYGAGYPEGSIFGRLRSAPINIAGSNQHMFWDNAGSRRVCDGDSGGPYMAFAPDTQIAGGYREVVIGTLSTSEGGHPCTSAGGEQYAARIGSRIAWFRLHTGRSCVVRASIAFCNQG